MVENLVTFVEKHFFVSYIILTVALTLIYNPLFSAFPIMFFIVFFILFLGVYSPLVEKNILKKVFSYSLLTSFGVYLFIVGL